MLQVKIKLYRHININLVICSIITNQKGKILKFKFWVYSYRLL